MGSAFILHIMEKLKTGQFFGMTTDTIHFRGVTTTDTEYTHDHVDWHFHENAYFTFVLQGKMREINKTESYECPAGTLLFHNWQEPHCNSKPPGFTRGFQIELEPEWFESFETAFAPFRGSVNLKQPALKTVIYNIFKETKMTGAGAYLEVDTLLIELFSLMSGIKYPAENKRPGWTIRLTEILHDDSNDWRLSDLAKALDIHPVHLSRGFPKYFHCSLGEYIRKIRIQHALSLLTDCNLSLTEIAYRCHFADQSHFIRVFKSQHHITPLHYRKLLLG
jgi:AraC family transcriptional regulator